MQGKTAASGNKKPPRKNRDGFVESIGVEPTTFPNAFGTLWPTENYPVKRKNHNDVIFSFLWRVSGSNRRPLACHASALAN